MVDGLTENLLRRHIGEGADHAPDLGDSGPPAELGHSEVHDLHPAIPPKQQVVGLDVAVNDALGVGRLQSFGDLDGEQLDLVDRDR